MFADADKNPIFADPKAKAALVAPGFKSSGCSVARYRAWFGTRRSQVRILPSRQKKAFSAKAGKVLLFYAVLKPIGLERLSETTNEVIRTSRCSAGVY